MTWRRGCRARARGARLCQRALRRARRMLARRRPSRPQTRSRWTWSAHVCKRTAASSTSLQYRIKRWAASPATSGPMLSSRSGPSRAG
eukprot:3363617-Pyramimonas_sp.AAC.1